jgi:hypothetical protein
MDRVERERSDRAMVAPQNAQVIDPFRERH